MSIPSAVSAEPNLFMVGAPKSGTTALATYLTKHPDVFVAAKELNYFSFDLDFRTMKGETWRVTKEAYLAWFSDHVDKRHRGDHSVFYLYSQQAANAIHDFNPESRIIIMLRNPVDQMHSQHSEMLFQGDENLRDFAQALAAEDDRKHGRQIPPRCRKTFGLFYKDLARYAAQVERYFTVFGRNRVSVILYDDLVTDTPGTYRQVLQFLEVDPDFTPEFAVINANKVVRSTFTREFLRRTPASIRRLGRLFVRNEVERATLRRRLHALNTQQRPRPAIDPKLRLELEAEFAPEIRRLEELLGRDLGRWSSAAPASGATSDP